MYIEEKFLSTSPDKRCCKPLFRAGILTAKNNSQLGSIQLNQQLSARWVTAVTLLIGTVLLAFVFGGSITRRARVAGITVPTLGSISIVAPSSGVLVRSMFREGDFVSAGQELFELSTERQVATGEVSYIVSRELIAQDRNLDEQKRLRVIQNTNRRLALNKRLESMVAETTQVNDEKELVKKRYRLAERSLEQFESLKSSGYMSSAQVQQKQEDLLDLAAREKNVERNALQLQSSRRDVEAELSALDTLTASDLSQIQGAKSSVKRELAENRSRKSLMLTSRESGVITTITYQVGQAVSIGQVLAGIIPATKPYVKGSHGMGELEVHLYAPSRSAGFVARGQKVLIRYQAFPYQKFGLQSGIVSDVSATPFAPSELPSSLASTILSNAQQNINGFNSNEALYRIKVKLTRQTIVTYRNEQPLRPGMTLEADVIQDRRKIWEWIAEPLLAVAAR